VEEDEVDIPFDVRPEDHGTRVDVFLSRRIRRMSRNRAADIVRAGQVRLDGGGGLSKPSARVLAGMRLLLSRPKLREPPIDDIVLPEIHVDDALLAVNKPGDLVVHPTATVYARTVIRVLRVRRPGEYLTLAHRIDKETSGALVLVRDPSVDARIKADFAERRVKKAYLAIVVGVPRLDAWVIDAPMRLVPGSETGVLMEIGGEGAAPSVTEISVLARGPQAALVEARPLTGRQHQIRLHLAHAGHPIIGDKLYLGDEAVFLRALNERLDADTLTGLLGHWRQALHARRVELTHPRTGLPVRIEAPLPPDMAALARRLRIDTSVLDDGPSAL
jgi:23S rRNA pseudouridine1911/1915/1917 synthase